MKGSDISRRGPFVAGKEITYADLVLFQLLHDENLIQDSRKGLQEFPRLVQLVDGFRAGLISGSSSIVMRTWDKWFMVEE